MRSQASRADRGKRDRRDAGGRAPFRVLSWSAKDAIGVMVGAVATIAILVNVLFMQSGSHPAPMFKGGKAPAKPAVASISPAGVLAKSPPGPPPAALAPAPTPAAVAPTPPVIPRARPADAAPSRVVSPPEPSPAKAASPAVPRAPGEIITDIQKDLVRRGYYDGVADGLYGPKTDAAIREFEHAAGLKPSVEPNESLLAAITRASPKLSKAPTSVASAGRPMPVRNDQAADRSAFTKRVLALQRALAEYGYGQIKPTGVVDSETQAAIEKFERERKLPVTGQASDRVARELAAMTGRPLE